jgi:hypothetical protein
MDKFFLPGLSIRLAKNLSFGPESIRFGKNRRTGNEAPRAASKRYTIGLASGLFPQR